MKVKQKKIVFLFSIFIETFIFQHENCFYIIHTMTSDGYVGGMYSFQ